MKKFKAYSDLIKMIPKEVLWEKLTSGDSELEPDMLCFEENYIPVANNVPRDFTIVDCGCYMAAQSYLFSDFEKYIGVDNYDKPTSTLPWYKPPERFETENSKHYSLSIREFIESKDFNELNLDKTYFICSAVPSFAQTKLLFDKVKNCAVFYPSMDSYVKGICKNEILSERNEIINEYFHNRNLYER